MVSTISTSKTPHSIEKNITLNEFLSKTSHLMIRNSTIFSSVVNSMITSFRYSSKSDTETPVSPSFLTSEVFVRLTDNSDSDQLSGSIDALSSSTLKVLIEFIISSIKESNNHQYFSSNNCINALSDCLLSLKPFSFHIVKKGKDTIDSLFWFLLQDVYKSDSNTNHQFLLKNIQATTRLITVLSSHLGPARKFVLESKLKSFKEEISSSKSLEENQMKYICRLSQLIPLVCSSCKSTRESQIIPPQQPQQNHHQHMSVDILTYFLNGGITSTLVQAIDSFKVTNINQVKFSEIESTLESLFELLEIFTRPTLLHLLENKQTKPLNNNTNTHHHQYK